LHVGELSVKVVILLYFDDYEYIITFIRSKIVLNGQNVYMLIEFMSWFELNIAL